MGRVFEAPGDLHSVSWERIFAALQDRKEFMRAAEVLYRRNNEPEYPRILFGEDVGDLPKKISVRLCARGVPYWLSKIRSASVENVQKPFAFKPGKNALEEYPPRKRTYPLSTIVPDGNRYTIVPIAEDDPEWVALKQKYRVSRENLPI